MSEEGVEGVFSSKTASPSIITEKSNVQFATTTTTTAEAAAAAVANQFQISPSLAKRCHQSTPDATPILLQGSKTSKIVIGRGHDATIKIGKSNKCVSREHVAIEHKPHLNGFELTILSPNGALIDHIIFDQGEHVPVIEGTLIEIVGTKLVFQGPKKEQKIEPNIPLPTSLPQAAIAVPAVTLTTTTAKTTTKAKTVVKQKSATHIKMDMNHNNGNNNSSVKKPMSLEDEIVQILVITRKSTMTCTDIWNRIGGQTFSDVSKILSESSMIGCIPRSGKLADGSIKEDLYYYKPELDNDVERRKKYSDVGRSARKCTMKDTQYFFRIPPKLPTHKASNNKMRKRTNYAAAREREEDEELISNGNSSDDASDMEVYELFKDV